MDKIIISFILSVTPILSFAQKVVEPYNISIDFDRVIHIVLPSNVEYVAAGSKAIEAVKVEETPNIVRIVAMEENFLGRTNTTIISKSGEVYTYNIEYNPSGQEGSVFFPQVDRHLENYYVSVNDMNAGHIIFPKNVVYFKQGNEQKFRISTTAAANILRVEPASSSELLETDRSNLFAVDNGGNVYSIDLNVGNSSSYTYNVGDAFVANVSLNESDVESLSTKAMSQKRTIYDQGFKKNKFEFSLNNLFVHNEQLFFVFEIKNKSNIDLDIDFIKCFIIDEKPLKNAVQQDPEVDYKYKHGFKEKVTAKTDNKFVIVFDKFTIPDKKVFKIEMYEKGGGRHINFKIGNDVIIKAKNLGN